MSEYQNVNNLYNVLIVFILLILVICTTATLSGHINYLRAEKRHFGNYRCKKKHINIHYLHCVGKLKNLIVTKMTLLRLIESMSSFQERSPFSPSTLRRPTQLLFPLKGTSESRAPIVWERD